MKMALMIVLMCCVLSAVIKCAVHIYLDTKNGHESPSGGSGYMYLFSYNDDVAPEYEKTKRFCNIIQKILVISLIMTFLLFIINGGKW